uniref:(northern house mosquito) hypothetical protein n=1 Tax=Culex pipiens TaxID=7175 RepID=A0A8D8FKK6_CULPI
MPFSVTSHPRIVSISVSSCKLSVQTLYLLGTLLERPLPPPPRLLPCLGGGIFSSGGFIRNLRSLFVRIRLPNAPPASRSLSSSSSELGTSSSSFRSSWSERIMSIWLRAWLTLAPPANSVRGIVASSGRCRGVYPSSLSSLTSPSSSSRSCGLWPGPSLIASCSMLVMVENWSGPGTHTLP